ncbi:AraC family transcriptional regulator [Muricoccus nepalensis]|nr:AraC family transcriptional regulator [Roseomonas nepalensis]
MTMTSSAPGFLDGYLVVDVRDPDELGADSGVSRRFPSYNNAHRYRLRRPPPADRPEVLTRLAMHRAGDLLAGYVGDTFGTEVEVAGPGLQRYCLGMVLAGSMQLRPPNGEAVDADPGRGLIYRGEAGTRFLTEDGCARWNLWIEAQRVERALEGLLGRPPRGALAFAPALDLGAGGGASLKGLMDLLSREVARPDGMAANPLTLASVTDLVVQTMLLGLPHSQRDALERQRREAVVPGTLRRAEAFMRASADQALSLAEVAAAAGCSLRALYAAFRRFRDTTPLAALQAIRLEEVRAALARASEGEAVMAVARRHGFTNRSRLAAAWTRRFGEPLPRDRDRRPRSTD